MAAELPGVLRAAQISPSYILVGHSYSGLIVRGFLAATGADAIAGMMLLDANQENMQHQRRLPFSTIQALCGERKRLL
ncbi:hypothetical protein N7530_010339 [Penicillium desertorum]|uniref:AB hydrolase-1 domain-containing protein n=1 Tax=Penicillium desertorum TaxID=1303715 RepID=A0A9W9WH96_9EURO|nr:hypothetical protein N7530_010339 [Penicillium desertorum]